MRKRGDMVSITITADTPSEAVWAARHLVQRAERQAAHGTPHDFARALSGCEERPEADGPSRD